MERNLSVRRLIYERRTLRLNDIREQRFIEFMLKHTHLERKNITLLSEMQAINTRKSARGVINLSTQ